MNRSSITTKTHPFSRRALAAVLGAVLGLSGCAPVGPNYTAPELDIPGQYRNAADQAQKTGQSDLSSWWQALGDAELTRLIDRAVANNLDARQAASRVRAARLQLAESRSSLYPAVDANGSARKSEVRDSDGNSVTSEAYSAGFDADWELDIFGGTRRSIEAAGADLAAEIESLRDVMVSLLAEVALNYIDLRTYQGRLAVARSNVATQQQTWELLNALSEAGRGDELAVAQARYNLENSKAKIPALEVQLEGVMNRLAVLLGEPAGTLNDELAEVKPLPTVDLGLAVGVPADIIRQRPDIRQAERQLAAQTARVGQAEAELYPHFTLKGSIGLESVSLGDLFGSPGRLWSIGPTFSWPVFDAGAIRNNIKIQNELQNQALLGYEKTVLTALEEVENALVSYAKEQQVLRHLRDGSAAARLAAELAGQQYVTGMIGFSDVLDAQRSSLSLEDQQMQSEGAVLGDLVLIYKALGGGWQVSAPLLADEKK